jgi:hypothetical protein
VTPPSCAAVGSAERALTLRPQVAMSVNELQVICTIVIITIPTTTLSLQVFHDSLLALLQSRALFFEFGVGGSTRYARSLLPPAQMFGLDSSRCVTLPRT